MSVAPTFGSVGDIISVCALIKELVSCLNDARGSAKEYRDVVETLESLDAVISQFYEQTSHLSDSEALRTPTVLIATSLEKTLIDFREALSKYGPSLQSGGSGNAAKDAIRKVQFRLSKNQIETFRGKIQTQLNMLIAMLVSANHMLLRQSEGRTTQHMETIMRRQCASFQQHVESQIRILFLALLFISRNITGAVAYLSQVFSIFGRIFEELQGLRMQIMKLEYPLHEEYFLLNDAIGRTLPIPLCTVVSWRAFRVILVELFSGRKGARRVSRGRYALEDSVTKTAISDSRDWALSFRPKQRIDMSLHCIRSAESIKEVWSCPRCFKVVPQSSGILLDCTSCDMQFKQVIETTRSHRSNSPKYSVLEAAILEQETTTTEDDESDDGDLSGLVRATVLLRPSSINLSKVNSAENLDARLQVQTEFPRVQRKPTAQPKMRSSTPSYYKRPWSSIGSRRPATAIGIRSTRKKIETPLPQRLPSRRRILRAEGGYDYGGEKTKEGQSSIQHDQPFWNWDPSLDAWYHVEKDGKRVWAPRDFG